MLVAQMVKNLPAMQDTWVWSLDLKDPLEKGMATHSNIFAWRIPWTEEPSGLQSMASQRVGHDWVTNIFTYFQWRCRHKEQTFGHRGERRGWNELREQHWNRYITISKIDSQWEFSVWRRELKSGDNLEGWEVGGKFKREGKYVYLWQIHVDLWQKPTHYCKAIILQSKINCFKKL